jgi:hypothetical protein
MIPYNVPLKRQETYGTTQNNVSASQDIRKRETRSGKEVTRKDCERKEQIAHMSPSTRVKCK